MFPFCWQFQDTKTDLPVSVAGISFRWTVPILSEIDVICASIPESATALDAIAAACSAVYRGVFITCPVEVNVWYDEATAAW